MNCALTAADDLGTGGSERGARLPAPAAGADSTSGPSSVPDPTRAPQPTWRARLARLDVRRSAAPLAVPTDDVPTSTRPTSQDRRVPWTLTITATSRPAGQSGSRQNGSLAALLRMTDPESVRGVATAPI